MRRGGVHRGRQVPCVLWGCCEYGWIQAPGTPDFVHVCPGGGGGGGCGIGVTHHQRFSGNTREESWGVGMDALLALLDVEDGRAGQWPGDWGGREGRGMRLLPCLLACLKLSPVPSVVVRHPPACSSCWLPVCLSSRSSPNTSEARQTERQTAHPGVFPALLPSLPASLALPSPSSPSISIPIPVSSHPIPFPPLLSPSCPHPAQSSKCRAAAQLHSVKPPPRPLRCIGLGLGLGLGPCGNPLTGKPCLA